MKDERKTKALLIEELMDLRQKLAQSEIVEPGKNRGENLQRLKEFHETIVQSMAEGIVVEDADGYFTFVNTAATEMLGYATGELDGKHWTVIVPPDQYQIVNDADQRRLQGDSSRYEINLLHKDGSRIRVQVCGSPRFKEGDFEGTLAVFANLSERVIAEQVVRESEEQYRLLTESMNDIIWTTNLDLQITYIGPAVKKMLGYSPEEYAQLPIEKRYSGKSFREISTAYQQGLADLSAGKIDIENFSIIADREFLAKDGRVVFGEESISLLRDENNNVIGLQGITRDISERKRAEFAHNQLLADFEHRNLLLQTAAEVSKSVVAILSPDELLQQTVNLIRERFGYYYVGIFLIDGAGDFAVLQAGTGKEGERMLAAGHKLAVGGGSMIGWSVAHAQARIALDVGEEAVWFDNPYLPDTRSEMALPLVVHSQAIGALTVQSEEEAAFADEDIAVLQTMADQLAIAIQNARLYDTAQSEIAERQRAERLLFMLNQATLAMEKSLEPDEIFSAFAEELKQMGFSCMVFPTGFSQQRLFTKYLGFDNKALRATEKLVGISHEEFSISVDDAGVIGDVVRNRHAEYVEEAETILEQWLPKTGKKLSRQILKMLKISKAIFAPMMVEDNLVGVLSIQAEDLRKDDIPAMTAFANQVAAAWRRAQLFEQSQIEIAARKQAEAEIQRRSQQLAALVQMGQTVASTLDLDEVLNQVINIVPPLVGAEGVSILLLEGQDELVFAAVSKAGMADRQKGLQGQRMPATAGIAGAVIQTGRSIQVKDTSDQTQIYRELEHLSGFHTQSMLAVPLSLGDEVIGVMEAVHSQPEMFSDADLQMLEATASWASIAMGNARQHESIHRRFQESQTMAIISQALTETLDVEEVLQLIGESAQQVIPAAERTVIHLLDDDKQALWPVVAIGLDELGQPGFNLRVGEGIAGLVIGQGTTINVGDTRVDPRYLPLGESTHLHSLMVAPVHSGQRRLGTISVQSAGVDAFSLEDERMVTTLGFQAAVAIENARLFEAERKRSAELETLRQASLHLTSTLELQPALETILVYALKLVAADDVHIFPYDGERLTFGAALWAGEHQPESYSEPRPDGLTYNVARKGERIVVPDFADHPIFRDQSWRGAIVGLPLRFGDEVRGVMNIAFDEPHVFDENELRILELLADQAAVTLENARLFEAERVRRQEAETLREATAALTLTMEVQEVVDQILIHLEQVVPYDSAACVLLTPGNRWQVVAGRGFLVMDDVIDRYHDAYSNEIAREIVQTAKAIFLDDAQVDPRFEQWGHTEYVHGWMGVPLIVRGEAIGYLTIDSKEVGAYGPSEAALVQAFANQAAVAIENANLYKTTKELADRLLVLHQASQRVIGATTDPENIYSTVHEAAVQLMPCEAFSISILDEDAQEIEGVYLFDLKGRAPSMRIPVGAGLSGYIIENGTPLLIYDVNDTPQLNGVDLVHYGSSDAVRALIAVPMKIGGKIIGALSAQSYLPHQYTLEDQLLLEMLAAHAAVALDNERLFEDISIRLREVNTLYRIIQVVVASLDVDEILQQAVNSLQRDFGYYHVHVYLFDEDSEMLVVREGSGMVGNQLKEQHHGLPLGRGVVGRAAKTGQMIMSNDVDELEYFFRNPLLPDTSAELAVPLHGRDGIIGVLDIQHQSPNTFDEDDIRLVSAVADQLSVALDKAMVYAELHEALHKEQSTRAHLVQADKLTALGRIVASVAHELNNPLQAIQNAIYLVEMENTLTEQAHEDLEVALTETARMANLIGRLRDTYRPTTAEEFQPESLNQLVTEVHKLLATHLRHNNVSFEFLPDPNLPEVRMVGDQIKQVILNLSLNAIEIMPGGGKLQVKTGTVADDILLSILDIGPGIEANDLPHIFDPFYSTKEGGTGLGLSITYDIVHKHGGRIEVESELGRGSTFKVLLPIRQ